jgi:pimeloyl-ACP methyl ester carboxylesterase
MAWKIDGVATDNSLVQRDIQTPGLQNLHFVEGGNPEGLPVLLLHDNLASSRWWEALQESLPFRYHSLAPDLRGYGLTTYKPVTAMTDFSHDLHEFVTALGLKPFWLVGWGLGGGIAMQYALEHPEKLVGLCLVNSISPKGHRPPAYSEELDQLTRALRSSNQAEVATYLRRFYFQNGSFPVGDLAPGSIMGTGPKANEVAFNYIIGGSMQARNFNFSEQTGIFQVMRDFDIHQEITATSLPVTLITSAGDRVIRPAEAREVRQVLLNNNRVHDELILTQCGHSPMVECPDKFNPAVAGFLGRLNYQPVIYPSMSDPVDVQEAKALKAADAVAW